jgi:hypothetical protein
MSVRPFGQLPDGTAISEIRLTTAAGASASIITLGATVRDLVVPLPNGETRRVVLGFPTLDGYLADTSYLGATAGRYASRIGGGRFRIDDILYQLTLNEATRPIYMAVHKVFHTDPGKSFPRMATRSPFLSSLLTGIRVIPAPWRRIVRTAW